MITNIFLTCDLDIGVLPFFKKKFNLPKSFWTVTAKALIFHRNILWDKTFPCGTLYQQIWPCDLDLGFVLPSENFHFAKNFWTVCVKLFLVTTNMFTLWPWPSNVAYFLKAQNFDYWVLARAMLFQILLLEFNLFTLTFHHLKKK